MQHQFDLAAEGRDPAILIDAVDSRREVGPQTIVEFFGKLADVRPEKALLVAVPRLSKDAEKLTSMYRLDVVAAETAAQAADRLMLVLGLEPAKPNPVE